MPNPVTEGPQEVVQKREQEAKVSDPSHEVSEPSAKQDVQKKVPVEGPTDKEAPTDDKQTVGESQPPGAEERAEVHQRAEPQRQTVADSHLASMTLQQQHVPVRVDGNVHVRASTLHAALQKAATQSLSFCNLGFIESVDQLVERRQALAASAGAPDLGANYHSPRQPKLLIPKPRRLSSVAAPRLKGGSTPLLQPPSRPDVLENSGVVENFLLQESSCPTTDRPCTAETHLVNQPEGQECISRARVSIVENVQSSMANVFKRQSPTRQQRLIVPPGWNVKRALRVAEAAARRQAAKEASIASPPWDQVRARCASRGEGGSPSRPVTRGAPFLGVSSSAPLLPRSALVVQHQSPSPDAIGGGGGEEMAPPLRERVRVEGSKVKVGARPPTQPGGRRAERGVGVSDRSFFSRTSSASDSEADRDREKGVQKGGRSCRKVADNQHKDVQVLLQQEREQREKEKEQREREEAAAASAKSIPSASEVRRVLQKQWRPISPPGPSAPVSEGQDRARIDVNGAELSDEEADPFPLQPHTDDLLWDEPSKKACGERGDICVRLPGGPSFLSPHLPREKSTANFRTSLDNHTAHQQTGRGVRRMHASGCCSTAPQEAPSLAGLFEAKRRQKLQVAKGRLAEEGRAIAARRRRAAADTGSVAISLSPDNPFTINNSTLEPQGQCPPSPFLTGPAALPAALVVALKSREKEIRGKETGHLSRLMSSWPSRIFKNVNGSSHPSSRAATPSSPSQPCIPLREAIVSAAPMLHGHLHGRPSTAGEVFSCSRASSRETPLSVRPNSRGALSVTLTREEGTGGGCAAGCARGRGSQDAFKDNGRVTGTKKTTAGKEQEMRPGTSISLPPDLLPFAELFVRDDPPIAKVNSDGSQPREF